MFKSFLTQAAFFLVWCFGLFAIAVAPIVLDTQEAIAAMLVAAVAVFSVGLLLFWNA